MHLLKQLKRNFLQLMFLGLVETQWLWDNTIITEKKLDNNNHNLSLDQQKNYDKIQELQNRLDFVWAKEKLTQKTVEILYKWLSWDPSIKDDPEALPTIKLFQRYSQEFQKAKDDKKITESELIELKSTLTEIWDKFEYNLWIENNWNKMQFDNEKLKYISSKEFLQLSENDRLQYVTKGNVDSENVSNWSVKDIEISFDQDWDWKINKEFYMLTTLWQILPSEVRQVLSDGQTFTRLWLNWEFYSWSKRLTIHDKTKITIDKIWSQEELKLIDLENERKYNDFVSKNTEYKDDKFTQTIKETFSKWIDKENELLFILNWKSKNLENSTPEDLKKLLVVSKYLKNSWFLDDYIDAWELVSKLEDIIDTLNRYWKWLKYSIWNDWNVKFSLNQSWLPEWIELEANQEKFTKIALSQLWVNEFDWWADKYFSGIWQWNLNSRDNPWCGAFVNWCLKQSGYPTTWGLSAKEFIWETWYGHVWIKLWNKLLWWNQWNKVSLMNINKPIVWYAIPTENWLKVQKPAWNLSEIPDWAILVFDRKTKRDKNFA